MQAHDGVVTKAQAEAAQRMKEMVLQDSKAADQCVPSLPQASGSFVLSANC